MATGRGSGAKFHEDLMRSNLLVQDETDSVLAGSKKNADKKSAVEK